MGGAQEPGASTNVHNNTHVSRLEPASGNDEREENFNIYGLPEESQGSGRNVNGISGVDVTPMKQNSGLKSENEWIIGPDSGSQLKLSQVEQELNMRGNGTKSRGTSLDQEETKHDQFRD